ncbi:uncharacterized protein LOC126683390 [Mercurialis annua]|uniref:uncharacterized protein LOC126683390 n=1 Tax=Mercurialis annua TaxID=3986 RepID=UPI00215FFC59|nr:uncharacterized protein LOC126683390 [Mercurialis annua]
MVYILSKSILCRKNGFFITTQNPSIVPLLSSCVRYLSMDTNQSSVIVSYLINSFGLSPESALSISKSVNFEKPGKPNLVLSFFKNLGFSVPQISKIISRCPTIFFSDQPEKTIFPKVEFFRSKGASSADLIKIFTIYPWLLKRSLENQLAPCFEFFRGFHQSDEKTITAIKRYPSILSRRLEADVVPNINVLRDNGVPASNILLLIHYHPQKIGMEADKFRKTFEDVREMGFNPSKSQFVLAIIALTGTSRSMWDRKVDAYKTWGWSDEDIHRAFGKSPWCMTLSEDKIMAVMDFYVNKLGLDSAVMVNRPLLLSLSLKKRLIPRGSVIEALSSKGLIKIGCGVTKLFECTEEQFIQKCIECYEEAPELLKLYNEKLDLSKQIGDQQSGRPRPEIPFGLFRKAVHSS